MSADIQKLKDCCDDCINDPNCQEIHDGCRKLKAECEAALGAQAQGQVRAIDWGVWLPVIVDIIRTLLDKYAAGGSAPAAAKP